MNDQINKLKDLRDLILQTISSFPESKRNELLFGKWNLKDVIAHLNNWMVHDIDCLAALRENRIPFWEPSIDEFNKKGVDLRRKLTWTQLCDGFTNLSNDLINIYKNYPIDLMETIIWPDHDETPEKFIREDIEHWQLELKNIQSKL